MMNGPKRARHWVTDFLTSDLPTRLLPYRIWWGLDTTTLPTPEKVLSFEPFAIDAWPMVYTIVLGSNSITRTDYDFDENPKFTIVYNVRTYVWAKAEGSEAVTDMRDDMVTVVTDALLDNPAVSSYGQLQTDCSAVINEGTIRQEFSDITLLKGERMLAGGYIQYDLEMTETVSTDPLGVVSMIPTVLVQLIERVTNAPTVLLASDGASGEIVLHWKTPTWNAGFPVVGYKVEQSTDSGDNWSTTISDTGVIEPTYTVTGLTPASTYMFRVSGINAQGIGAASSPSLDTVAP